MFSVEHASSMGPAVMEEGGGNRLHKQSCGISTGTG